MIRSSITISLVPEVRGGPFVFWDGLEHGCQRAAEIGFDAVEVFARSAQELDLKQLRRLLDTHKLKLAAIGTGAGWVVHHLRLCEPEVTLRRKAKDFVKSIVDAAAQFGAPAIIGSMQGRWGDGVTREQALAWLTESLHELGAHAQRRGTPLLFEPLNRYETNLFTRVSETIAFLDSNRIPNVKILCDLFHMNIEEADIPTALRAAGPRLGHVHFADSNRQAIGFGHTDVAPIAQTLKEMKYEGYLSAEIFPLPDSETAARKTIESFKKLFPSPGT